MCQNRPGTCISHVPAHLRSRTYDSSANLGSIYKQRYMMCVLIMPPPLGAGGIMFSGWPSVRPSVRPSEAWNTLFWPVHGSLIHPTNRNRFTACPSVRPSGEVSGHLPENARRDWPEILHADVSWPSSEMISLWSWSVDFSNFGTILT